MSIPATVIKPFLVRFDMPLEVCEGMIEFYNDAETNNLIHAGTQGGGFGKEPGVDPSIKESMDYGVSYPEILYTKDARLQRYLKELRTCLETYFEVYPWAGQTGWWDMVEGFNIQKYPKGGGFKQLHTEWGPTFPQCWRQLVFMTYLNDCDPQHGGGTNFFHQNVFMEARAGVTLIWPSSFEWMHVGIPTEEKEKMIATGWYHILTQDQHKEFIEGTWGREMQQYENERKGWAVSQGSIKTDPSIKSFKPGEAMVLKSSNG